jgi:hypothetical protein
MLIFEALLVKLLGLRASLDFLLAEAYNPMLVFRDLAMPILVIDYFDLLSSTYSLKESSLVKSKTAGVLETAVVAAIEALFITLI